MKRLIRWLKNLFFPPAGSSAVRRILPYALVVVLLLTVFVGSLSVWEGTNATVFCGTACHTMPPEYITHQASSHASITCEDCHLGRAPWVEEVIRKAKYSWQTGTATLFNTYTFPIFAKNMSPASDACTPCHNPSKFSGDKVMEIKEYAPDVKNTLSTIFLILKTGGGSSRQGLGFGIHWHIENPVYYYATDAGQQTIPYIRVKMPDGRVMEYVDTEANFDPKSINDSQLKVMDCITCHNRAAHNILSPEDAVNQLMSRDQISPTIPEIRLQAQTLLDVKYASAVEANAAIDGLTKFYQDKYPDFYATSPNRIQTAIESLKSYIANSEFFDQKVDYSTHPNNIGHEETAGCFRCHDGKHISASGESIRLECNLCHSVPVVSSATQLTTNIQVSKGIEPPSHKNTNWITIHRQTFDNTCAGCHTVEDAGGTSNKSFCSNSECHGTSWKFAGFDAPNLRIKIQSQIPTPAPTSTPAPTKTPAPTVPASQATPTQSAGSAGARLTWVDVGPLFEQCATCHGAGGGTKGLDFTSYAGTLKGGDSGTVIVAGKPESSKLVEVQTGGNHPVSFTEDELNQVIQWIKDGALEK